MTEIKIRLPEKVNAIIETLQSHGYEAYAVGGCVRDSLLGQQTSIGGDIYQKSQRRPS